MRLCSIASGSSGNCIYVGSEQTHLLIDTGISKKRIDEVPFINYHIDGDNISFILQHRRVEHDLTVCTL